jgi:hypothetical protein
MFGLEIPGEARQHLTEGVIIGELLLAWRRDTLEAGEKDVRNRLIVPQQSIEKKRAGASNQKQRRSRPVGISQMIPQVKGTIYRISFAQSCRADDPAPGRLGVYWGSTLLDRARCSANETSTWVTRSYTVTATSNDPVMLKFTSEGSPDTSGVLLDNVNVDAANETLPVPEFPLGVIPAFLFGLVGFIHIIRKDN